MATFKYVIFPKDKRRDGTVNIKIRVIHNRKTRYLHTPFYVTTDQMTRGGKLKDAFIESQLTSRIAELRRRSDQIGFAAEHLDVDKFIAMLDKTSDVSDYVTYARKKIDEIRKDPKRKSTADRYSYVLNSFIEYNGSEHIPFSKMTKTFIRQYYQHLRTTKKLAITTVNSYISMLSSLYNSAREELNDEELDVVIVKYNCFKNIGREKEEEHDYKAFESVEQMQRIIDAPRSRFRTTDYMKDMFVFSFVCFGMNLKDIQFLTKDQVKDGILTFRRRKVERRMGARAEMQIQLCDVAKAIIEKYSGDPIFLIECNHNRDNTVMCKDIYRTFKAVGLNKEGSGEHYTFNSARHSMATFLINVCRVDKSIVHQMLVHSNVDRMAITDWYIKRDYSLLWEANEKLLALFDWSTYLKTLAEPRARVGTPLRPGKTHRTSRSK